MERGLLSNKRQRTRDADHIPAPQPHSVLFPPSARWGGFEILSLVGIMVPACDFGSWEAKECLILDFSQFVSSLGNLADPVEGMYCSFALSEDRLWFPQPLHHLKPQSCGSMPPPPHRHLRSPVCVTLQRHRQEHTIKKSRGWCSTLSLPALAGKRRGMSE